jgi:hypothetical protein
LTFSFFQVQDRHSRLVCSYIFASRDCITPCSTGILLHTAFTFEVPKHWSYTLLLLVHFLHPRLTVASRNCVTFLNTGILLYTGFTFEVPERQSYNIYTSSLSHPVSDTHYFRAARVLLCSRATTDTVFASRDCIKSLLTPVLLHTRFTFDTPSQYISVLYYKYKIFVTHLAPLLYNSPFDRADSLLTRTNSVARVSSTVLYCTVLDNRASYHTVFKIFSVLKLFSYPFLRFTAKDGCFSHY